MRAACIALLSGLALAVAGCGSEDVGLGQATAAQELKQGALVYWETTSDPDSDQWEQAEELIRRFPDGDKWIAALKREFESSTDVTWERDVKPALGEQVAVAVYGTSFENVSVVGMTNPDDPEKTIALVKKLDESDDGDPTVTRTVGDWVVVGESAGDIDAALKAEGSSLADSDAFSKAMDELPDDAASRVYVDASRAIDLVGEDGEFRSSLDRLGLGQLDFAGAWAKARDDGAELGGVVSGEGADKLLGSGDTYSSKLLDRVPADAFAFFSMNGEGTTAQFDNLRDNPLYGMGVREFERELGVKLEDIVELFRDEVAFYAAPGAPIPQLTLLCQSDDPARDRATAARVLRAIAERTGGKVTESGDVTTATFEGVEVHSGSVEGAVVISTSTKAFQPVDEGLADSEKFKDALDAADAPDEYTSLLWADLRATLDIVLGYARASGEDVPGDVSRNLEPLRSLVAYGTKDGAVASSLAFLEIE